MEENFKKLLIFQMAFNFALNLPSYNKQHQQNDELENLPHRVEFDVPLIVMFLAMTIENDHSMPYVLPM